MNEFCSGKKIFWSVKIFITHFVLIYHIAATECNQSKQPDSPFSGYQPKTAPCDNMENTFDEMIVIGSQTKRKQVGPLQSPDPNPTENLQKTELVFLMKIHWRHFI